MKWFVEGFPDQFYGKRFGIGLNHKDQFHPEAILSVLATQTKC